jgi:drug/metabolite transporter (DMT)-like permease
MGWFQDKFSKEKQGEAIIMSEALLWGLFPVITVLSLKSVPALLALAWSTLFATIFFALILFLKKGWSQLKNREVAKDILLATLILGILYYVLFFFGLNYTSPGNASIIALTEAFFSFCFFNVWHKEYVTSEHIVGAILMIVGGVIVLYPNVNKIQIGDLLILSAVIIAPLGNYFQRRARKSVSSEAILFVRSTLSMVVIFALAYFTKENFAEIGSGKVLVFLVINGFFLLGLSKLLWIEGIHRIGVMKANALNGLAPLVTLLFAWILLGSIPTKSQLLSFIPMFFGVVLLSMNKRKISANDEVVA